MRYYRILLTHRLGHGTKEDLWCAGHAYNTPEQLKEMYEAMCPLYTATVIECDGDFNVLAGNATDRP